MTVGGARIAVIGGTAQRVKGFHMHVDLEPEEFVVNMFAHFRNKATIENLRILLARAEQARDGAFQATYKAGAMTEGFAIARWRKRATSSSARRRFVDEGADLITFTQLLDGRKFLAHSVCNCKRDVGPALAPSLRSK